MLSSYRLGDLVLLNLTDTEKDELKNDHPNTIGYDYILNSNKIELYIDKIDIITNIVLTHIQKNINLLPKDIENSSVLHLRLGDVVGGNKWYETTKRPLDINYLKSHMPTTKIYVIGKCFFAKPSSTNYEECIELSNKYLEDVINTFNAIHFDGGSADIDLCCAIKAKHFIQGRGYFSKLIVEIRKKLNLENIETHVYNRNRRIFYKKI
jgi:hypothetical protein